MSDVQMAIEPQERTLIENAISLLQQLMSMGGGGETPAPEITEAMPPDDMEYQEEITKAVTEETGDTKAEDRLDNQATPLTDENLSDLKKTMNQLQQIMGRRTAVQKSNTNNPILAELKKLNQSLAIVMKAQQEQELFNQNIMRGIGFSDEMVAKTLEAHKPVEKNKPYNSGDAMLFAKEIISEVFKNLPQLQQQTVNPEYQNPFNQRRRFEVNKTAERKPIHDVLDFIHNGNRGVA